MKTKKLSREEFILRVMEVKKVAPKESPLSVLFYTYPNMNRRHARNVWNYSKMDENILVKMEKLFLKK